MRRPGVRAGAFARQRSGSAGLVFALATPVLVGMAAFAVDMGEVYVQHRTLQAAVDAAALAAAAHPETAATAARQVLDAAGQADATLTVLSGRYDPAAVDRDDRFLAGRPGNAVRIEARRRTDPKLGRVLGILPGEIAAHAEAALVPVVSISVGSRLASVDPRPVNAMLSSLTGVRMDLTSSDVGRLAHSRITLGALLRAVAGDAAAGSPAASALERRIRLTEFFAALSREMQRRDDPAAAASLEKAARQTARSDADFVLDTVLRVDQAARAVRMDYPAPVMDAEVSVLDLFTAASRRRQGDGRIDETLPLPGIGSAQVAMQIGEAGRDTCALAVSEGLPHVDIEAIRLRVRLATSGVPSPLQTRLELPLELVGGGGTAQVLDVRCSPTASDRRVTVRILPGVAKIDIGSWTDVLSKASVHQRLPPAEIATILGAKVEAQAHLLVAAVRPVDVTFSSGDISSGTIKTARTETIAESLVASMFGQTRFTVAGASLPNVGGQLGAILSSLAQPVDGLLASLLSPAGVGLGEVDLRVDDVVCRQARIVG